MKFRRVISVILALLAVTTLFAACSPTSKPGTTNANGTKDDPSDGGSSVKMKFLKAGRSSCIVIRTPAGNVMIDTAADDKTDKVLTYLAEKSITTIDYLIITNYSKKHIGGAPAILASKAVTVKNVYAPAYSKGSATYNAYAAAMTDAGLTATLVSENTEIKLGDVTFTLYAPHKDYSTGSDENDECNSVAVGMTYGEKSFLMTSRIKGERVTELLADLNGKKFDLITVPNYGIYDNEYDGLFTSLGAADAIAFCSNNADKTQMDVATINALTSAKTRVYATRDGSIEVEIKTDSIEINGTPINNVG